MDVNYCIKSKMLKKGDTIGIIAPSYQIKPEYIEQSIKKIITLGFNIKLSENLYSSTFEYAGSVEERATDFNNMISDTEVDMLLFGGGEVSNELLPYINYENIRSNPKIICSYSDSTSILNAVHSCTGLITFYGASLRTFGDLNEYNLRSFESRLMSTDTAYEKNSNWKVIRHGKCCGILSGGYLVNYASLFATPYFKLQADKKYVLFIEDHKMFSSPAVVSKWFSNLEMYGAFNNAVGLIFGHYANEDCPIIDDILLRIGEKYDIPVVWCNDFGHGEYNSIFPIGIPCSIDTENGIFELLEDGIIK